MKALCTFEIIKNEEISNKEILKNLQLDSFSFYKNSEYENSIVIDFSHSGSRFIEENIIVFESKNLHCTFIDTWEDYGFFEIKDLENNYEFFKDLFLNNICFFCSLDKNFEIKIKEVHFNINEQIINYYDDKILIEKFSN